MSLDIISEWIDRNKDTSWSAKITKSIDELPVIDSKGNIVREVLRYIQSDMITDLIEGNDDITRDLAIYRLKTFNLIYAIRRIVTMMKVGDTEAMIEFQKNLNVSEFTEFYPAYAIFTIAKEMNCYQLPSSEADESAMNAIASYLGNNELSAIANIYADLVLVTLNAIQVNPPKPNGFEELT